MHVSRNHLEGSLSDTSLDRVLAACRRHLVTGAIKLFDGKRTARIELRAGVIDRADVDGVVVRAPHDELRRFHGEYEIDQQLPDLTGDLGGSALAEGDVSGIPFVALMRHCEHHALTCTITVRSGDQQVDLEYKAGEIGSIFRNGARDDDAIVDALRWTDARFRVAAPPLDLDVEGWPVVRAATSPFTLKDARKEAARAPRASSKLARRASTIALDHGEGRQLIWMLVVLLAVAAALAALAMLI